MPRIESQRIGHTISANHTLIFVIVAGLLFPQVGFSLNQKGNEKTSERRFSQGRGNTDSSQSLVSSLIQALKNKDQRVQEEISLALVKMGPSAVPSLIKILSSDDQNVRWRAVVILGNLGLTGKSSIHALTPLLKDDEDFIREAVSESLGKMGSEAVMAVSSLVEVLNDSSWAVRSQVVRALGKIGPASFEAVSHLIRVLETDPIRIVRFHSVEALGQIGPVAEDSVPALIQVLSDRELRLAAVEAIGKIGPAAQEAVPVLVDLLGDDVINAGNRPPEIIVTALQRIGNSAVEALVQLLHHADGEKRRKAAFMLRYLQPASERTIRSLTEAFYDSEWKVSVTAIETLNEMGDLSADHVSQLMEILEGEREEIHSTAAWALSELGKEAADAVPVLARALEEPDEDVREWVLKALRSIGTHKALEAIDQFKHKNWKMYAESFDMSDFSVNRSISVEIRQHEVESEERFIFEVLIPRDSQGKILDLSETGLSKSETVLNGWTLSSHGRYKIVLVEASDSVTGEESTLSDSPKDNRLNRN